MKILIFLLVCITPVLADDFTTTDGKEYKDARVTHVEPDGVVVKTKTGISKLYFSELPQDVQKRFNYNPQQAAAYSAAQAAAVQTEQGGPQPEDTPLPNQLGISGQQPPGNNGAENTGAARQRPRPTPRYTTILHPLPVMRTPAPNAPTAPNTPLPAQPPRAPTTSNKPVQQPPPAAARHPKTHEKKPHK